MPALAHDAAESRDKDANVVIRQGVYYELGKARECAQLLLNCPVVAPAQLIERDA